tara:strand:+ start:802 stop:987 length:186 start_codon:yes stop_codon:yes gene_type:complete
MDEQVKTNTQKKEWKSVAVYDTYAEAKVKSESLEAETKIKRCGPQGTKFRVKAVKRYLEAK